MQGYTGKSEINAAVTALENYRDASGVVGVRVVRELPEVGAALPVSYRWEDGYCTGEELSGTSAIVVPIKDHVYYPGEHIIVIEGNDAARGEDEGELVIFNAVCLAVIK